MSREPSKSATIREIARRAGVSIASVSRALNGKPGLSEALRDRILAISREIEYRPSAAARQLISGKAAVVGISLGRQEIELRPYYILLYQHLTLALHEQGMVPIFFAHDQTATLPEQAGAAILLGGFPDDTRAAWLIEQGVTAVRIGEAGEGFSVAPDDRHGLYLVTRHLIAQGRRHIAFLGGELAQPTPHPRLQGYRLALAEAGLTEQLMSLPHEAVAASLTSYRALRRRLAEAGGTTLPFDALVCATDELALGCLAALEDHGIAVPEEVAVTGFDDLPVLASGLTTVRQDIAAIAATSVTLLGEALAGKPPRHVSVPVELVVRQSG
ncbi:LacI family DNA-binding transcriptional regulator [Halomonas sp. BM-2019]|uniref:LacI family DNA-binding transcriptional regulator n=1 Tax=Halomonas sp. BM-2019 TaxID=2811227 RepID=UPI001B3C4963|nr:MAG: LacI family DNA-binding transcriptional regulator [Halomonas sp. BM-2019]